MAAFRSQDTFGLDRELKEKEDSKRDPALEAKVQAFVEEVTGEKFKGGFMESLRDGVLLCKLMNKVVPGAIKKINESTMPFKQMENISNFLKACRSHLKMSESDLFTTPDLFDERSPVNVVSGLIAFSRAATKNGFKGPCIAPKESVARTSLRAAGKAVKRWSLSARNGAVSMLNMGSAGIMERPDLEKRGVTFGSDQAGKPASSADMPALSKGSFGIQDKPDLEKRGVTFGSDMSGASRDRGGVSRMNQGSAGIMDKVDLEKRGATFGADMSRR